MLRVGLIGCGDRGTGAATQALAADSNVKLVAMADAFEDRLEKSLETLQKDEKVAGKLDVKPDHRFVGFDAYQRAARQRRRRGAALHAAALPPASTSARRSRPASTSSPRSRSPSMPRASARSSTSCELAKTKGLSVVSGLCLRYDNGFRETVRRIHDGAIGEVVTLFANDYRSGRWAKPRQPDWTEMHYQMRNWYNFTWLSGDFNVEQHVHFLDVCAWVMKDQYPVKAVGMGGRQVLTGPEYGQIYDHFSVVYEYADGAKLVSNCRQQPGCKNDMSVQVIGTQGPGRARRSDARACGSRRPAATGSTTARRTRCTRPSTTSCSPASATASRSTTASTWPRARCWRSWAAWPPTPARRSPGRWR